MDNHNNPFVYRSMTASQAAEAYDDELTIPDLALLLQENRERAKVVKDRLNPICDVAAGDASLLMSVCSGNGEDSIYFD